MTDRSQYSSIGSGAPPPQQRMDTTLRDLAQSRQKPARTWFEACECCFLETVRAIAIIAVYAVFYMVPFAVYADRERQIPEAIRHQESFSVSTMRSHSMYAWNNLAADGERHRSVLRSQDYYAFTFFVHMINLLCWFPWTLMRYFRDGRDAFLGVFAVTVIATAFYHLLEQEVGVQGLMQLESTAFSLALGFVVRESSPPRFSGRMAFTLFCLWDFLNQKLGFRVYSCAGWTLHVALALFLWGYTNYTHQLYPGSLVINYMACMALIRFFNFWSDHDTRTQEIVRVQRDALEKDQALFRLMQRVEDRLNTTSQERQIRDMRQGLKHVPERMQLNHSPMGDDDGEEVGFAANGDNMEVFIEPVDGPEEDVVVELQPSRKKRSGGDDDDDDELFPAGGYGAGYGASSSHSLTPDEQKQLRALDPEATETRSTRSRARGPRRKTPRPSRADVLQPTDAPFDSGSRPHQTPPAAHSSQEEDGDQGSGDEEQLLPTRPESQA